MKKCLSIILTAAILLCAAPLAGFTAIDWPVLDFSSLFPSAKAAEIVASGDCGDYVYSSWDSLFIMETGKNVTWTLDTNGLLKISGKGSMAHFDSFDHRSASWLSWPINIWIEKAPWSSNKVKKVVIENGVTNIGDFSFYECSELQTVSIPKSVTDIGNNAFKDCHKLNTISIPEGVSSIGVAAFSNCSELTDLTLPKGLNRIGRSAFHGCVSLTSITIPAGVASIGRCVLSGCSGLNSISVDKNNKVYCGEGNCLIEKETKEIINGCNQSEIPSDGSVTSIGEAAFYSCSSMTSIVIPNTITKIGPNAFYKSSNLSAISIPDSVTSVGENAFLDTMWYNNQPDGLLYIGKVLYKYKGKMPDKTSILLKRGTTEISASAFKDCIGLCSINIPDTVKKIGSSAFYGCIELTEVTLPDGITSIGSSAFCDCAGLTSVAIPDGVTSIEASTFRFCTGLTSVIIPDSVTSIGGDAFQNCTGLTSLIIPDSVISIGYSAFSGCTGLKQVIIPDSVTRIEDMVFYECGHFTIYGKADSYAREYAESNYIPFVAVDFSASVILNKQALNIKKNTISQLTVLLFGKAANQKIVWTSSNPAVAVVSSTGKVTAKGVEKATVTAATADGKYSAACEVTVVDKWIPVSTFNITQDALTLHLDEWTQIYYNILPWNATDRTVTWTSSAPDIVSINADGIATAKKKGTAIITGVTNDGAIKDSQTINVVPVEHFSTKVDKEEIAIDHSWFVNDSAHYNHDLARFTAAICFLGYTPKGKTSKENEQRIKDTFTKLGFSDVEVNLRTGRDEVNYFIASKKLYDNNKEYTLVFTGFIGSNGLQWDSNFDPYGTESNAKNPNKAELKGSVHIGFDDARDFVETKIENYIKNHNLKKSSTKLLITGHSRGAATANLVASDYIREEKIALAKNIFAYTFATPKPLKASDINDNKYKRIFNFVNPEDFVTKMMPGTPHPLKDWGFGRYGTTIILPSITNDAKCYNSIKNKMTDYFYGLCGRKFERYDTGEVPVCNVINRLTEWVASLDEFYNKEIPISIPGATLTPFWYFKNVLCPFVDDSEKDESTKHRHTLAIALAGDILVSDISQLMLYSRVTGFFVANGAITQQFHDAHCMETYYSFVKALNKNDIVKSDGSIVERSSIWYIACCPVDIEVIDNATGEVVAKIVNNVIDPEIAAKDNALVVFVNGDEKTVVMPSDGDYDIRITGNDDGVMDYTVSEMNGEGNEISRTNYFDVPVTDGLLMMPDVLEEYDEDGNLLNETAVIVNELGETEATAQEVPSDDFGALTVAVETEGVGGAVGAGQYTVGDYVTLTAATDENNTFLGYYENGELLTKETDLSFVVKENRTLTAKFTDKTVAVTGVATDKEQKTDFDLQEDGSVVLLTATVQPANATDKRLVWSSSDETVATVTESGVVSMLSAGTVTMTVQTPDGKYKDAITLTVTDGATETFLPGDVDGDGEVTSGDARLALRASVQLEKYEPGSAPFLAADVDKNGAIESSDARTILRVSVKLESFR